MTSAGVIECAGVAVVAADAIVEPRARVGDEAGRSALVAAVPMVEEAGIAWAARLAGAALTARVAASVVRHVRAAAARVERIVRARVPVVAVLLGRRQDEAAEGQRTVVPAVVEVVRVAVVALLTRVDDAVAAEARRVVRRKGGRDGRMRRERWTGDVETVG